MNSHSVLQGAYTAVATPFSKDASEIDYESLANLIEFQLDAGISGIVVCGSTGEAATLSEDEYRSVIKKTVEIVARRVPVVAGVGSNNTKKASSMGSMCRELGVDMLLTVCPFYNKPSQEGIYEHFKAIKEAAGLPLIAYNVPGRTSSNLEPKTLKALAENHIVIGVKEASGNATQMLEYIECAGNSISVLSGEDNLVYNCVISGGKGVISATANLAPKYFSEIVDLSLRGEWKAARDTQLKVLPLFRAAFAETNPVPVKAGLKLLGIIKHSSVRLPLIEAKVSTVELMRDALSSLKLL